MMVHRLQAAARRNPAAPAAAVAGAVLALLAVLSGCGTQPAGTASGAGSARPSSSAQAPGQQTASLTIAVTPAAGSAARRWTLQCGPSGGSLPGAATACTAISRASDPFGPVPRGTMCSMIYSGPQTATVQGTWNGKAVDATYSRANGCQTARWNKLASLFPAVVTPGPTAPGGGQVNPGGPMLPPSHSSSGTSSGGMSAG
jgi:subtilisin inhibitor-like